MRFGTLADDVIAPSVEQILRLDQDVSAVEDVDGIHDARVATRRLRTDLRTFRAAFDDAEIRDVRAELQWLGLCLGVVRDMDVLAERLVSRESLLTERDQVTLTRLERRVVAERARAVHALRAALASERHLSLTNALRVLRATSSARLSDAVADGRARNARVVTKRAAARWRSLARAVRDLSSDPSSESLVDPPDGELHDLRILAKRCRYACEASERVVGKDARRLAREIVRVQDLLGEHQDAAFAESWLRVAAGDLEGCDLVIGELIAIERIERARCRGAWLEVWTPASKRRLRRWF